MDEELEITPPQTELTTEEPVALSLAEFLESVPPSQTRKITDLAIGTSRYRKDDEARYYEVLQPDILIHCQHSTCNGLRVFRSVDHLRPMQTAGNFELCFNRYRCSNCNVSEKIFCIMAKINLDEGPNRDDQRSYPGQCYKIGEDPIYGPPTPARLISLIGPDRETFLKGRRCENQGLGVGAFVYYRRVVENQKSRILDQIIKVAEKTGASSEFIERLKIAKAETQFKKALEFVRDALPQVLLINGQNPLTLLHSALSQGLHTQTDEHCLALAHAVRVVLTELSDRLGQTLKDEAELMSAISLLTKPSV